jgi:hypothetical protein
MRWLYSFLKSCLPAIFGGCAIILGTAGMVYCETVKFAPESGNTLYVSPWYYRSQNEVQRNGQIMVHTTCLSYNYIEDSLGFNYSVDAKTRTVMAFSIMTPIIGGLALIGACLAPCMSVSEQRWKGIGTIFILMSIFQGITLLVQSSSICNDNPFLQYLSASSPDEVATFPEDCEWAAGYMMAITAVALWFVAGACCYVIPAPFIEAKHPPQEQTVTYTQRPDGTVEETNVTVVKGHAVPSSQDATDKMEAPTLY